jgi:hypothetical protein
VFHIFFPRKIDDRESRFDKFAHRMCFSSRHHIIIDGFVFQDQLHRLGVIMDATPISLALQIPEDKLVIEISRDTRGRARRRCSMRDRNILLVRRTIPWTV